MKRVAAVVVLCGVLAAVFWFEVVQPFGGPPSHESSAAPNASSVAPPAASSAPPVGGVPQRPADAFAMTVRYVYDGDTIQAQMVTPNDVVTTANPVRIRLIGIDTPEGTPTPECWADEARADLSAMLPEGSTVWAASDRDTWDDYQRRLFYLWTDDGRFVNHELVAAGDAEAIRIRPNDAHYDLLLATEEAARTARAGQWGACG